MGNQAADGAVVDAVLTASRTLVGVATRSLGAAAEHTTIAQYRALVVLASRGPQRLIDLAEALDVTPSTAGRMSDRLVRKRLARRHRARADRRSVLVSLTPAGRQVVDQATARRRVIVAEISRRSRRGTSGRSRRHSGCSPRRPARSPTASGHLFQPMKHRVRPAGRDPGAIGPAAPVSRKDGNDGYDGGGSRIGGGVLDGEGRRLAARRPERDVRPGAAGGRRGRARGGRVPLPDLLLHLAGHRA